MSKWIACSLKKAVICLSTLALIIVLSIGSMAYADESSVSWSPTTVQAGGLTDELRASAKSRLPMVTDPADLPPETREMLGIDDYGNPVSQAYGTGGHPFTTKRAGAAITKSTKWLKYDPWRGTGKLWMRFGPDWFVCTASVIDKGLIVTAAHCVHNYGQGDSGFADEVIFEPVRHDKKKPLKSWDGIEWWIPTVYYNGTDVCTTSGVVCENDIAIVVLEKKEEVTFPKNPVNTIMGRTTMGTSTLAARCLPK